MWAALGGHEQVLSGAGLFLFGTVRSLVVDCIFDMSQGPEHPSVEVSLGRNVRVRLSKCLNTVTHHQGNVFFNLSDMGEGGLNEASGSGECLKTTHKGKVFKALKIVGVTAWPAYWLAWLILHCTGYVPCLHLHYHILIWQQQGGIFESVHCCQILLNV
jgi:hypothetical protein